VTVSERALRTTAEVWYNTGQKRMSDRVHTSRSIDAAFGWCSYARFYAWRFS
jgi:hypothetical protein